MSLGSRELRERVLANAKEALGSTPVRNVSTQRKTVLVGLMELDADLISDIANFCGSLDELNDPIRLGELMREEISSLTSSDSESTYTLPDIWVTTARNVAREHWTGDMGDPRQHKVYSDVNKALQTVAMVVLRRPQLEVPRFEDVKGTISLAADPETPYTLFGACPVSGIIHGWEKAYFQATQGMI